MDGGSRCQIPAPSAHTALFRCTTTCSTSESRIRRAPGAPRGSSCICDNGGGRADHRFLTVLSAFTATRVYLSEQFPTALARSRAYLRRIIRPTFRWRPRALSDGTVYGFSDNFLRGDFHCFGNRRLYS